jgi:hypothetical protein
VCEVYGFLGSECGGGGDDVVSFDTKSEKNIIITASIFNPDDGGSMFVKTLVSICRS